MSSNYKKEKDSKQEKKPEQEPSLETENNLSILRHIFARFILQPKKLKTKQRLKQEFLARTHSLTALNRLTQMLTKYTTKGLQLVVRIDLKPAANTQQLLNDIKDYIPLDGNSSHSVRIKLQSRTFSPNRVNTHLKHKEKIHNAITIPTNDFAAFIVEQVLKKQQQVVFIPLLANQNNTVSIVGVTLDSQPTAIIFRIDGTTGKAHPAATSKRRSFSPTPRLAMRDRF